MEASEIKNAVNSMDDKDLERVAPTVELIVRDKEIRRAFEILKKRYGFKEAMYRLAAKYFLSVDQIDYIVYRRTRETNKPPQFPPRTKRDDQLNLFKEE